MCVPKYMHRNVSTEVYYIELMYLNVCIEMYAPKCVYLNVCAEMYYNEFNVPK